MNKGPLARYNSHVTRLAMKNTLLPLLFVAVSFALTGCVTCQECGSLKRDHEITRLFLGNEIVPGCNYYFAGRSQWPTRERHRAATFSRELIISCYNASTAQAE